MTDDDNAVETTFTREQFYEKLWSLPTKHLAAELGCSDVMVGKVCKAFNIPKPYVGYWARLAHGQKPKRTKLPKDNDPSVQSLTFRREPKKPRPAAPPRESLYDAEINALLAQASTLGPIKVPHTLRNPHQLILDWQEDRAQQKANKKLTWERRLSLPPRATLDIHVSEGQEKRACLIMDAFIQRLELLGGEIRVERANHSYSHASTTVHLAGDFVSSLRLRERSNMVKINDSTEELHWLRNRTELVPNGMLLFDSVPSYMRSWMPKDTKTRKLEDQVGDLILGCITRIGDNRLRKLEEDRNRLIQAENQLRERERAAEMQPQREEVMRRQAEEQSRIEQLRSSARAWRESNDIRMYLDAFCAIHLSENISLTIASEAAAYLRHGHAFADRLDPLHRPHSSVVDEPNVERG